MTGPLAWDGFWSYWLRIFLFVAWIVVMFFAAVKALGRSEHDAHLTPSQA